MLVVLGNEEPWKVFKQGSGMIPFLILKFSVGAEVGLEEGVGVHQGEEICQGLSSSRAAVMHPESGSWGGRCRFRDVRKWGFRTQAVIGGSGVPAVPGGK